MFEKLLSIVSAACTHASPTVVDNTSPRAVRVNPDDIVPVCRALYQDPETYFDMLSCLTGIDNGPAAGTIDLAYNLYSVPYNLHLTILATVPRDNSEIDSVTSVWKTANWHERELYDLFGVTFRNHPDLRRILLPADWQGHPLRKDYQQQEYYKNIKLDY
jgi:NADH-quinone oxidoreductase subunit C